MGAPAGIELLTEGSWNPGSVSGEWSPGGCGCGSGSGEPCSCGGSCGCKGGGGGSCGGGQPSGEVPLLPDYDGEIWAARPAARVAGALTGRLSQRLSRWSKSMMRGLDSPSVMDSESNDLGEGFEDDSGQIGQDDSDLCAALLDCYKQWASGDDDDMRRYKACLGLEIKVRNSGVSCPPSPEAGPFDPKKNWEKCRDARRLKRGKQRACRYHSKNDVIRMLGCTWRLRCVCKNFPDSPGGECMRGCIECLHHNGLNYGEEGHKWCRAKCELQGLWNTVSDKKAFISAVAHCIECADPLWEAAALSYLDHWFEIYEVVTAASPPPPAPGRFSLGLVLA